MQSYRKVVAAKEIDALPLGQRVEGTFQTYISFETNGKHKLCIGDSCVVLPHGLFESQIKTEEMFDKLAFFLEKNHIKSRVRGFVVEQDQPVLTLDEELGDYYDTSPILQCETFEPEIGLKEALRRAAKTEIPKEKPILLISDIETHAFSWA